MKEKNIGVVYLAVLEEAVYVLHAFCKKTQKTPKKDLEMARKRLVMIRQEWVRS